MNRAAVTAAVLVVAAAAGGCAAARQGSPAPPPARAAGAAAHDDRPCPPVRRLVVSRRIAIGAGVGALAVHGDALWAARAAAGTVTRVSAGLRTIRLQGIPASLTYGFGRLWVTLRDAGGVVGLDPQAMTQVARASLPVPVDVVVNRDGLWALSLDEAAVWQLLPTTGAPVLELDSPVAAPVSMVPIGDELWVLGADGGVSPVDVRLQRIVRQGVGIPGRSLAGLSDYGSTLWLGEPGRRDLLRIRAGTVVVVSELPAPGRISPIATAATRCGVWVGGESGTVALIDPSTGASLAPPVSIGRSLNALAVSGQGIWASDPLDGTVVHVTAVTAG